MAFMCERPRIQSSTPREVSQLLIYMCLPLITVSNKVVRAHIYSKHAAIYCERCYTAFRSDEALLAHTRQISRCDVRDPRPMEGLTKEQKELLKPRDRNKSEEERWNAVYKICFPNDQSIPSPCK